MSLAKSDALECIRRMLRVGRFEEEGTRRREASHA
jgi:hypothetical protein